MPQGGGSRGMRRPWKWGAAASRLLSLRLPGLPASLWRSSVFGHPLCGRGLEERVSVLLGGSCYPQSTWDSESTFSKGSTLELSRPQNPGSLAGLPYPLLMQSPWIPLPITVKIQKALCEALSGLGSTRALGLFQAQSISECVPV